MKSKTYLLAIYVIAFASAKANHLVWSQGNTPDAYQDLDTPVFSSLFNNAFSGENGKNIFLVKFTYRFLR